MRESAAVLAALFAAGGFWSLIDPETPSGVGFMLLGFALVLAALAAFGAKHRGS